MTIRPLHQQYLVKKAGGGSPDPATYCPANGYIDPTDPVQVEDAGLIPNPIIPADGWNLLLSFDNNSPNTTTFDPSITTTAGQYAWDLGDGTILVGDKYISHTYLTTATRTVKLYGKGTCTVTGVDFSGDNIVGSLDLSNSAFSSLINIILYSNASMTGVTFASTITGTISYLQIYSTGITGTFDLSKFTAFTATATIQLYSNASMTGVTFASTITGTITQLWIHTTGITGVLDLSKFTAFTANATIYLHTNASMTGITFASTITGTITQLHIYSTGITGVLDLSKFTAFTATAAIYLHTNASMTGVTFASSITGTIGVLYIYSTGITGVLNLSMFTTFTTTAYIQLNSNASMTGVTFASSITGTIASLLIFSTGITGTLDLSKFTAYTATATVDLHANTSMTGVTFKSTTIAGIIKTLRLDGNTSLGYVDITKLVTGVASLSWRFGGNGWSAAIVNQVLVDANSISASGFASRIIDVGGSNTDPDTTSGGVDGVAARTALQGKSFTVTIT